MAFAKELQSEASCGERVLDNESENDNQGEQTIKSLPCSGTTEDKDTGDDSRRGGPIYSFHNHEWGNHSIHSPTSFHTTRSDSIRSLHSSVSLGGGIASILGAAILGEADTVDDTFYESIRSNKGNKMLSLREDSSLDTNEDDFHDAKTIGGTEAMLEAADEKRKKRIQRIEEMEKAELQRRDSISKRKQRKSQVFGAINTATYGLFTNRLPAEIELKEEMPEKGVADCGSNNNAKATILPEIRFDSFSKSIATLLIESNISSFDESTTTFLRESKTDSFDNSTTSFLQEKKAKKSKKKSKKKSSTKSAKRKERKKSMKNNETTDSSEPRRWWDLSPTPNDNNDTAGAEKRQNRNSLPAVESSESLISLEAERRQNRKSIPAVESSDSFISLEDDENEDIKGSSHGGDIGVNTLIIVADDGEDMKNSGHFGTNGINEIIADLALESQDTIAKAEFDVASSVRASESLSTPNGNDKKVKGVKNSGYLGAIGLNEMIAIAAAKRQERIASSGRSPKQLFQSPHAQKRGVSSRVGKKQYYPAPLSPQTTEYDAASTMAAVDCGLNGTEDGDDNEIVGEMAVTEMTSKQVEELGVEHPYEEVPCAELELPILDGNEPQQPKQVKEYRYKKLAPIAQTDNQRREDKDNHRKKFVSVFGEAAAYGRLVQLEEKVVEAQGGANPDRNDTLGTWSGPKLLTDDRRSNALRAIQEAAALGRMKRLIPEIVTNGIESISDEQFDVENQVDAHGKKISRTNFLLDQHVKQTAQEKKERMFSDSDAVGDRDEKTSGYKDFDDVELPTSTLPTYDRILGRRLNEKKNKAFSGAEDLAMIAMQMSEGNLKSISNAERADSPKMTTKRLRVLELLSSAVAVSACERTSRLLKPKAELKVTRKCFCPYCKDPTPYQTHKYKRLMHPERFNDSSDPNNDSQEVGESSGAVSDTPMATQNAYTVSLGGKNAYTISPGGKNAYTPGGKNAYTISPGGKNAYTTSPGGRKKKVIRIVRRKTRRPTGGENSVTVMSSNGKKLNPQELDFLIEQLQRQGAKNMTTDELVLIANALSVGATTSLKNTPTSMKRETLSPQGLLAADLIAPPFITDDSSDSNEQRKSQDTTTGHLLQVANHLTSNRSISSDLMTVDTPTQHADLKSSSHISTILSSEVTNGDGTLTPTTSTHGVSVDTITKSLEPKKTPRGSKSRRSSQTQSKGKIKSPSSRKAKMRVGAAPPLPTSDQVSNEILISPQGKKKSARRRSKGVMLSPSETDPLTLPAPPSRTEGTQTKKSLRSRLNNGDRSASPRPSHKSSSVSEHNSQCNKDKTPKSGRRRVRRVKESSVIPSPRPRRRSTTTPKKSSSTKSRPEQQSRISAVRTGDEKQKWEPLRRTPSRTQSLPIGQNQRALQEFTHEPTDLKGRRKRQLDKQKSLTRISGLGNDQKRVPPCRTQSLKDELRSPSKHDVVPSLKELMSTTKKGRQNVSKKSVYEPSGVSPKPSLQSPTLRQRSLSTQVRKKQIDPPLRRPQIRVNHALRDTSWIPSVISVESPEIPDDITDSISVVTQPIFPETPDSSKSLKQEHQATKNVSRSKSLDRFKVKLSRGRGRTQPKKEGEKESVDTSLQVESESNENATRQGPARVFKRSLSLDRLLIGRRILQVKDSKKDNSQDKKGKNSKSRNWLRRGSLK